MYKLKQPTIGVVSLGCPKNTADTEVMLGLLNKAGFAVTFDDEQADICLVNTCSFIGEARQESVKTLIELAQAGKELVIAGCMAQHYKEELFKEIPEARALIGTGDINKVADVFASIIQDRKLRLSAVSEQPTYITEDLLPRISTNTGPFAYLKIAEGCNHTCSFCIIPKLRGKFRSRSIESLVEEAKILTASGAKEIILVSQDTTYYGLDIYARQALPELLEALQAIEGLEWIRIMYAYPTEANEHLLKTIARLPKVVKYIDIPLQHSHPEILEQMARPLHPERVVQSIRRHIPDVRIRTTFIVGFPGETDEHFAHLANFIQTHRFDRLGVFTYSQEMEVPSGHMKNQVKDSLKKYRRSQIMKIQQVIAEDLNAELVGANMPVLIEEYDESSRLYRGRSPWDAPQIDNQVYVRHEDGNGIVIGDISMIKINKATTYDLYGSLVETNCKLVGSGSIGGLIK
jgi:ribosomal protein S12 methylthiotransferase